MVTKFIHVNVNVIRHNKKYNNTLPACRVQEGSKTRYGREINILGPSKMVYRPEKPLNCGAKLWIETEGEIEVVGEVDYSSIKKEMESL
jgi:hypothetical protein